MNKLLILPLIFASWLCSAATINQMSLGMSISNGMQVTTVATPSTNPPPATITNGLVGWWKFDDGSGTVAADSSSGEHNGSIAGSPAWVTGKIGGGLNFTAYNQGVTLFTMPLDWWQPLTVSFWYKSPTVSDGNVFRSSDGKLAVYQWFGHAAFWQGGILEGTANIADGNWHLITAAYADQTSKVYVDGALDASASRNGQATTGEFSVVGNSTGFSIDDLRIYNRALSLSEIQTLFSNP